MNYFSSPTDSLPTGNAQKQALEGLSTKLADPNPRMRKTWKRGRSGEREEVAQGEPKVGAGRAMKRTRTAFGKVLRALQEGHCCANDCLQALQSTDIMSRATNHAAEKYSVRTTRLQDTLRVCLTDSSESGKHFQLKLFGREVCKKAFAAAHGLCIRSLENKMRDLIRSDALGLRLPTTKAHGNRGRSSKRERTQRCLEWMETLRRSVAQPFPQKTVKNTRTGAEVPKEFLPTGLFPNKASVFRHYKADQESAGRVPVGDATFTRLWDEHLYMVRKQWV